PEDYVFSPTGRKDSYNAGSFLRYLVEEEVIKPENLLVFAPLDYPHEKVLAEEDYRVRRFVESYMELIEKGVRVVPRDLVDAVGVEESLRKFLNGWTPRKLYISVDVDIAARTALIGSKFIDVAGILEAQVYEALALILRYASSRDIQVVGLDLMEIEPYRAGGLLEDGSTDRTYEVAANIVRAVFSGEILLEEKLLRALKSLEGGEPKILEELQRRGYLEKIGKKFKPSKSLEILEKFFEIKKKEEV
ncbi:MAG TPA: hypothetical protein ENF82_02430, partial [Candidatus Methanomethylia archaeon]|nr:hypothetical protein [Candidatus Methanomethylicia archaeon]